MALLTLIVLSIGFVIFDNLTANRVNFGAICRHFVDSSLVLGGLSKGMSHRT
jgi:hypothetical protein